MNCFERNCGNNSRCGVHSVGFFRFPKKENTRQKWLAFCGLPADFQILGSHRLCSVNTKFCHMYSQLLIKTNIQLHFLASDLYFDSNGKTRKLQDAIPFYGNVAQLSTRKRKRNSFDLLESDDLCGGNEDSNETEGSIPSEGNGGEAEYVEYEFLEETGDDGVENAHLYQTSAIGNLQFGTGSASDPNKSLQR